MAKLDERTRWHWESPIPPVFGEHRHRLHSSLVPCIILYRVLGIISCALALGLMILTLYGLDKGFSNISVWAWPIVGLGATLCIFCMDRLEKFVALRREPSPSIKSALNAICSMSSDVQKSVHEFEAADMLSFAVARKLVHGNQHLVTQANAAIETRKAGPGPISGRTGGDDLTLDCFSGALTFEPCTDGWYRAAVNDQRLHHMLCAGAAGEDAGIYWIIDHSHGIWGVPASYVDKLADRLLAISRMMPLQGKPSYN